MSKRVLFNVSVMVRGAKYQAGAEAEIDDLDYKKLSVMQRLGKPYVELVVDHTPEVEEPVKPKRKVLRRKKVQKETADQK